MRLTFDRVAEFLRPRLIYAKAAGALVWLIWFVTSIVNGGQYDVTGQIVGVDHLAFYSPARMMREGQGGDIYDPPKIAAYQRSLFPPGKWDHEYEAYRNPPFYALLYTPTTGLSYAASFWIWTAVSLLAFVLGVHLLRPERPWRTVFWAMTFLPVFGVISYGQNSLLSFAVLCGTYRLLANGYRLPAGLLAGLLWFKPPLLVGLVIWGLFDLRRLWPCAIGVAATGALLTLGTYPLVPEAWDAFFASLRGNVQFDNFEQWKMHNPRAFWRLLLPGLAPAPTILWLLCVALGLWAFARIRSANRDSLPTMFAAATGLMLWASPHTMMYEWAIAVVPAILLWETRPERRGVWLVLFAVAWVALFTGTDVSRLQVWAQKKVEWQPEIILQYSVILLGWVGWKATAALPRTPVDDPTPRAEESGLDGGRNSNVASASVGHP